MGIFVGINYTYKEFWSDIKDEKTLTDKFVAILFSILANIFVIGICIIPVIGTAINIGYILALIDNKNEMEKEKEKCKQNEREKIWDRVYKLRSKWDFDYYSDIDYIYTTIRKVDKNEYYFNMGINRLEYLLTIIETNNINRQTPNDLKIEFTDALKDTKEFVEELKKQFDEDERKIQQQVNEYVRSKLNDYKNTTKMMKNELEKIRNNEV
jgi:hypothetical protein